MPKINADRFIVGALDSHVHAAPSLFERESHAWDLTDLCRKARMSGLVLKSHHGSTVESASMLTRRHKDFHVLGGVALNHTVGGLNPYAVDAALNLGARIVWLPTIHAQNHAERLGGLGGFTFQQSQAKLVPERGIQIIEEGELKPVVKEIVSQFKGTHAVLGTGHISAKEIFVLHNYIAREKLDLRLLVNHVLFHAPALNIAQLKQLDNSRTYFELTYFSLSDMGRATTLDVVMSALNELPQANWILSSDTGQKGNPQVPKALAELALKFYGAGVKEDALKTMLNKRPKELFL